MSSKTTKYAAAPILVLGLASPALMTGCGDDILPGGDCTAEISARFNALNAAVNGLVTVAGEVKANVGVACSNIATDLGSTEEFNPIMEGQTDVPDEDVTAACNAASASITAAIDASATFSIAISGGKCEVNAEAQLSCEASCDVSGGCDVGTVEARCEPGKLSGSCSAECTGSCEVSGGSVECAGACGGTCEGACDGTCSAEDAQGNCMGECTGTCEGSCTGTCEVVAPMATCSGECTGSCSAEFEAPSCTVELPPPPECNLDADCQAGCDGQAKFEAECTPPSVVIEADADLVATLEANLPALLQVATVQGELIVDAAADVATKFGGAAEAVVTIPSCALQFGADFAGDIAASASASASVSVSVSASASASGSATSG